MRHMASKDAKTRFGELLDTAQREPVTIEKHGRPVAVLLSIKDYEELEQLKLDRLRAEIDKGLADIEAGRVIDGGKAFRSLNRELK